MADRFGKNINITLFGESHGPYVGILMEGLMPGISIDHAFIDEKLRQRRPQGPISTGRIEEDKYEIVSGVYEGKTTGAPLCILIPNENVKSSDYEELKNMARPGHGDYTNFVKSKGFNDPRGGGHSSGRLTTPIVAAGAIALKELNKRGIHIGTHLISCGGVEDRGFEDLEDDLEYLENIMQVSRKPAIAGDDQNESQNNIILPILNKSVAPLMIETILSAKKDNDSVGGILETAISGLPAGVGEPWFDSLEGLISKAIFSIPGVKGIEFGDGFMLSYMRGSQANDEFGLAQNNANKPEEGKTIITRTNHNGGINAGISNGMPVIFRTAVKPTPSIGKKQDTVDYVNLKEKEIEIKGRHDPCIAHRAAAVIDAMVAITLYDMLVEGN